MKKDDINRILRPLVTANLSPQDRERSDISSTYQKIKDILGDRCILMGSYARFTSITPVKDIDILINTTPIGMESNLCPIDTNIEIDKKILVCDIVYKPKDTVFIKWAQKNNLDVIYGIDMLINQALEAFYIWTNINPCEEDFEYIKRLYEESVE